MFKIEVFNALQTRFGTSKYTSLKTQPQIETHTSIEILNINYMPQKPTCVTNIVTTRSKVRWLILNSSHCTGNMYHIIHAQVQCELCISFLYSWIDVLDSNQPFNWRAKIREPFKMKLIWGLQSWPLLHNIYTYITSPSHLSLSLSPSHTHTDSCRYIFCNLTLEMEYIYYLISCEVKMMLLLQTDKTQASGEEVSELNAALMGSNASSPHSTAGRVIEGDELICFLIAFHIYSSTRRWYHI